MTTKLVEWTGRNGKPKSAILHAETANDPAKFRQWCEWNGYTPPPFVDTCIEHAYGTTQRLSFQVRVF